MSEFSCSWSLNASRTRTITWKLAFLADAERQSASGPFQDDNLDSAYPFHLVYNGKNAIKWRELNSRRNIKKNNTAYVSVFFGTFNEV